MTVHLHPDAADACIAACNAFIGGIQQEKSDATYEQMTASYTGFRSALQIGNVYDALVGTDLGVLVQSFVDQAEAMSMLFAAAGGLLSAQDAAVASALGKATGPAPELESLSIGSLDPTACYVDPPLDPHAPVAPEDVSRARFAQISAGAAALQPEQFASASRQLTATATALESGAEALHTTLTGILGGDWQGEFAQQATYSVGRFTESATTLAASLSTAAGKAGSVVDGYTVTRSRIGGEALLSRDQQGPGPDEQGTAMARAIVNTVYNPAVMDANLTDLDFPAAYRVVSGTSLGGAGGVDPVAAWNTDGRIEPAQPAPIGTPAAAVGSGAGGAGGTEAVQSNGGATIPSSPVDAGTRAALLDPTGRDSIAAAGAAPPGAGVGATSGAGAGGSGLNASTTAAAAAPLLANTGPAGRLGGSASAGILGRDGTGRRRERRGFGGAAGGLGAGATAAGLGAGAYGGAGTLAGHGSGAGSAAGAKVMSGGFAAGGTAPATGPTSGGAATAGTTTRGGMMPGAMMAAGSGAGRDERRGHTPAGYLVNATNTNAIIGAPPKASPAVLGRGPHPGSDDEANGPGSPDR